MTAAVQLELVLVDHPSDLPTFRLSDASSDLPTRLHALGLPSTLRVETHANRRVLVSLTARGALRVHLGFAPAPDEVLAAIARWAQPRIRRAERRAAQKILTAFPVHRHVPPSPPPAREARRVVEPLRPGDARILGRLRELHHELNRQHFGAALGAVTLRLSARMRRRLGEFRPADSPELLPEISISRRHLRRDGWQAVRKTLAHEVVHQWQAETGRQLGHDAEFRRKCATLEIDPRATRRCDDLR